jgi:hypothetical protein
MDLDKKRADLRMMWKTTFDVVMEIVKKWKRGEQALNAALLAQVQSFMREARETIKIIEEEERFLKETENFKRMDNSTFDKKAAETPSDAPDDEYEDELERNIMQFDKSFSESPKLDAPFNVGDE